MILARIKVDLDLLKSAGIAVPADHVHTRQVKAATTEAITLSGLQTLDGVSLSNNDLVLVKNQANKTQNGIYLVKTTAWVRDGFSLFTDIESGTENAGTTWVLRSEDTVVLGTSELQYSVLTAFTLGEMQAMIADLNDHADVITAQVSVVGNFSQSASVSANDASDFASAAHGYLLDTELWANQASVFSNQAGSFANFAQMYELSAYNYMGNTANYMNQAFGWANDAEFWAGQAAGSSGIPTGGNIGQVLGINESGVKGWIDQTGGGNFWDVDIDGDLMPAENPTISDEFELDEDGDIMPKAV